MAFRVQSVQLTAKLRDSKIILVTGPKGSGKQDLIQQSIEESNLKATHLDLGLKGNRKMRTMAVKDFLGAIEMDGSILVVREAQLLHHLQEIIEVVLGGGVSFSLVLSCSYLPSIDPLLLEVLESQGLHLSILPPTFYEIGKEQGLNSLEEQVEERLIFGNYPDVLNSKDNAQEILSDKLEDTLTTQLSSQERINKRDELYAVLRKVAYSIGQPLSYNEIGVSCNIDNETAERYVQLLAKASILIILPSYSNDHRYELKKSQCIYFIDNGIRNMIINNFNSLKMRIEEDQLWENWLIAERVKWNALNQIPSEYYFWQTHTRQHLSLLEQNEKGLLAYDFKWSKKSKFKIPKLFSSYYPDIKVQLINRSNYWTFLTKK